ncbi:F-box protein At3g59000-like isoform X1 [Bidens hawaiensis]|uniref:F-box protein At3g59000-like isoform X1 n=2 Tax=Bidens hawaiensis TaxID=980011 RepID=UPI00404B0E91
MLAPSFAGFEAYFVDGCVRDLLLNTTPKDFDVITTADLDQASEFGDMDRISQFPDFIVHHILSFCNTLDGPPAELVRMSVLSKTWFKLTASFPILEFDIRNFESRTSFFKYVEYTISRFCHENLTAHKLKLVATLCEPAELDIVNRCLDLVLRKGVKALEIHITNSSDVPASAVPKYCLPNTLLSASMLESLVIRGCELPSSYMVGVVKFKYLIQLALIDVQIDDEVIKCVTTSCPLLQELYIARCHGFKRFCIYGHQHLQRVGVYYHTPVEKIDIEAPNLCYLMVVDTNYIGAPRINVSSCKKLTTVFYFGRPLPNSNGFTDFLSKFPFIENLVLYTGYRCNNLNWSSHSLRTLVLHINCDFKEMEFNTPNLALFIYARNYNVLRPEVDKHWYLGGKCWPPVRDLTHMKGCMQCYPDGHIDVLWFQKLRLFLDKKNGFKVLNLYINSIYSQKLTDLEKLKAIDLPPYELEHVELQLDAFPFEESMAFVDAVLCCCRPRSLTLRLSSPVTDVEEQSNIVKFTFEKLLEQEDQSHTNIQIVGPSSSHAQKHLMELKSLSMILPREGETTSFIKEEVVQEEADA